MLLKQRCDLIAQANEQSYEGRQRQELLSLCIFLQANPNEIFEKDSHYIDRTEDFFLTPPLVMFLCGSNKLKHV